MKVADLIRMLETRCSPDWDIVIMNETGSFDLAYADQSGSEKIAILVPQPTPRSLPPQ